MTTMVKNKSTKIPHSYIKGKISKHNNNSNVNEINNNNNTETQQTNLLNPAYMGNISKVNKNKTTKVSHNAAKYIINRNDLWSPKQKQTTNEIPQITPEANKPSPNILSKTISTKTLNNIEVTPIESSNNIELPTPEIHGASTIQFAPDAAYSSTKHM